MAVGFCLHCQAELPDAGRFCVMCGRRVGHSLRDRSSDRRVYTSALGHSVPPELVIEIDRGPDRQTHRERSGEVEANVRSERTERTERDDRRHITSRTRARQSRDGALGDLWRSLFWAVVLSTLGALVAWAVYAALRRSPDPSALESSPSQGLKPVAIVRSSTTSRPRPPAAKPAASRELVIPVPAPPGATVAVPASVGPAPAAPAVRPEVAESLQNNDIDFVASQHSPQVRACYDRAFRHAGEKAPTGRVELSFVIVDSEGAGRAKEIATELNLLGEPLVAACLEEVVAEWRFPRPPPPLAPPASPRRLRYPFVFTPAPIP